MIGWIFRVDTQTNRISISVRTITPITPRVICGKRGVYSLVVSIQQQWKTRWISCERILRDLFTTLRSISFWLVQTSPGWDSDEQMSHWLTHSIRCNHCGNELSRTIPSAKPNWSSNRALNDREAFLEFILYFQALLLEISPSKWTKIYRVQAQS